MQTKFTRHAERSEPRACRGANEVEAFRKENKYLSKSDVPPLLSERRGVLRLRSPSLRLGVAPLSMTCVIVCAIISSAGTVHAYITPGQFLGTESSTGSPEADDILIPELQPEENSSPDSTIPIPTLIPSSSSSTSSSSTSSSSTSSSSSSTSSSHSSSLHSSSSPSEEQTIGQRNNGQSRRSRPVPLGGEVTGMQSSSSSSSVLRRAVPAPQKVTAQGTHGAAPLAPTGLPLTVTVFLTFATTSYILLFRRKKGLSFPL